MFEPHQTPASTAPAPNKTPAFFGFTRIPPSVANLDPTHVATLKTGVQTRGVRAAIRRRLEVQWARIQVVELIIYSDGQSLRTSFQKKQGSCISVYKYIWQFSRGALPRATLRLIRLFCTSLCRNGPLSVKTWWPLWSEALKLHSSKTIRFSFYPRKKNQEENQQEPLPTLETSSTLWSGHHFKRRTSEDPG